MEMAAIEAIRERRLKGKVPSHGALADPATR